MKKMLVGLVGAGLTSAVLAQTPNEEALRAQKKAVAAAAAAAADQAKANVQFNGQTFQFVAGQLISGPPVKGAPYSAEAVNETIQTLADGNRIVRRSSSMQYRDNEGRERREETSAMGVVFITDPVAGTRFTLHPDSRTAEKGGGAPLTATILASPGGPGPVKLSLGGRGAGGEAPRIYSLTGGRGLSANPAGQAAPKTEQLGNMYIEGVQAQGTRTTTTIPAGEIGNDRPINIVNESWYSPDLQMTVMTKHSDPRTGETNFQLKNINRSSPPPTLFEVPSDYTVTGGGGGRGGRGAAIPADVLQNLDLQKLQELQQQRK